VWTDSPTNGPGLDWSQAFHTLQAAVNAATNAGDIVRATNGVYAAGGAVTPGGGQTNRVVVTNAILVESVGGRDVTAIVGQGPTGTVAVRCAYLANGAVLSGFTLSNGCTRITGADTNGGGVYVAGTALVTNCMLVANTAVVFGGGVYGGTVRDCLIVSNRAFSGAGACRSVVSDSVFRSSCSTPDSAGAGNVTNEPGLASVSHLASDSPCIAAGIYTACPPADIDGEAWQDPPCMGCDQVVAADCTGALTVAIWAEGTNVAAGYAMALRADIEGQPLRHVWRFGDGTAVTNRPYATHAWSATGRYDIVLTAYNGTYPGGVSATATVEVVTQPIHYVRPVNAGADWPYTSWITAATNIQDAIDACTLLGAKVWVVDGDYALGGRVTPDGITTSRIVVARPVRVESAGNRDATRIVGQGPVGPAAIRCAYLARGAVFSGFTLCGGATAMGGDLTGDRSGGAVLAIGVATISNCVLWGNAAWYQGGGAQGGALIGCLIVTNTGGYGGGRPRPCSGGACFPATAQATARARMVAPSRRAA
jgi:hypothetical protein